MRRALVGLLLLAASGACTTAPRPPVLQADWLTVSGRHALPKAESGPLAGKLRVAAIVVDPALPRQVGVDPALYSASLQAAVEKSLANYGWLGTGADALPVTVAASPLTLQADKMGTLVTARLDFRSADASTARPCLARQARADFKALSPTRSGGGQRAFGWVAGITLAALSGPAGAGTIGQWMAQNDQDAALKNAALNSRRETAYGEGVAPSLNKTAEARFGGINATQLAIADYLAHLGRACAG